MGAKQRPAANLGGFLSQSDAAIAGEHCQDSRARRPGRPFQSVLTRSPARNASAAALRTRPTPPPAHPPLYPLRPPPSPPPPLRVQLYADQIVNDGSSLPDHQRDAGAAPNRKFRSTKKNCRCKVSVGNLDEHWEFSFFKRIVDNILTKSVLSLIRFLGICRRLLALQGMERTAESQKSFRDSVFHEALGVIRM
ncbi:hypothetical protein SELMODRAFT_404136 [Selaginella moellendorffii]|uniref:Uncharacterized protein n=1 Tax=Selaginella moellendorffii TaxID=88036 RepID=D8QUD9_SELML|nr:hypothetical protein SELMODRAFT_404136 [Selaginella moellendorffii]